MDIPSFDGKKTNRMLFFLFLCITFAVLAVTSLLSIFKDGVELSAMFVLAVITGVMSCWYGIHWVYNIYRDRFMEKCFGDEEEEEAEEDGEEEDSPPATVFTDEETFSLPREQILEAAGKRCRGYALLILAAVLLSWISAACILAFKGVIGETSALLRLLIFCALISVPGFIGWLLIRAGYRKSVPSEIALLSGKLTVGGNEYAAGDLESVRAGKEKRKEPSAAFRILELYTEDGKERFRIGFGDGVDAAWTGYDRFREKLIQWGKGNGVTVTTDG